MNPRTRISIPRNLRTRDAGRRTEVRNRILGASAASLLSLLAIPGTALAGIVSAPATFWAGGTDGTWTGPNWASDATGTPTSAFPTASDDVTFSITTGAAHQTTTLGADFTIRSLTINDPAAVTIDSGAGGPFTLTLSGNLTTGLNVQSGAGLVTIGANLTLGGLSDTITVNNTAGVVFNGALNATNTLRKQGGGTLTLAGPSNFSPLANLIEVAGGTLVVDNDGVTTHGTLGNSRTDVKGGSLKFIHLASAGNGSITTYGSQFFIVSGGGGGSGSVGEGTTSFHDDSTAGTATFYTGAAGIGGQPSGSVNFYDNATAADGTFITYGGLASPGGSVNFYGNSTAGRASITTVWGGSGGGGATVFHDSSNAQNATIIAEGGTYVGGGGGVTQFNDSSHAGNATLIANGGFPGGAGGAIFFNDLSFGDTARVQLYGNAKLDISNHDPLNVTIGSLEGSGNVVLGATSLNVGGNNLSTTFSGEILGSGALVKSGTGTLNLTGINGNTGYTVVEAGTLAVNGSIASPSTIVYHDGTLSGTGIIYGHVTNVGVVSPDIGGTGRLLLFGNYTQMSGAILRIMVAGTQPGQFGMLTMAGHASLDGALQVVKVGGATVKAGDRLLILTAGGGVSGTFSTATNPFANGSMIGMTVIYEANDVVLAFTQNSFLQFVSMAGGTPNQTAVARVIDQLAADPRATQLIAFLNDEPLGNIAADLDLLTSAALTSIFQISTSLANVQTANIQQRLADIRGTDAAGGGTVGGVSGGAQGPKGARGKSIECGEEDRWGLWFTGSGEFTRVGSTTNAAGFSLDSGGVTGGVDYRFTEHFAAGISLGYMNTVASLANGGKVDVDGGRIGAYATWFDRGLHFDAAVSGGPNSYATRRTTPNNTTATASPEGTEVNLLFAAGYDWKWKGVTLGPVANFQYTNVQLNGFTERGTFAPLNVAAQNAESLRTALGMHATFDVKMGRAIIRPEVRAAWQHEFGDTTHSLTSSFATLGGSAFTVSGPATGRDSLHVGAGFSIRWSERFATYAYYDAELLRTNYSSHNISLGFRYQF